MVTGPQDMTLLTGLQAHLSMDAVKPRRVVFTDCAVSQHCSKGDQPFQWEMPNFEPPYACNSLIFQHQNWHR